MKEYFVEFDFINTKWGVRANQMKMGFKTEEDAKAWAAENTTDGNVSWWKPIKK